MAFCTSCGAQMEATASVCPACGKSLGTKATPGPATAAPAAQKSTSALKVILIVLGSLFLLAFLVIALAVGAGVYLAKKTKVEQGPEGAKIETPLGTVETTQGDSAKMAEKMGVEVYPGARALPGAASVTMGSMRTSTAIFESDDPPAKIEEFYRKQLPDANVSSQTDEGGTRTVLMAGDKERWTTITIEGHEEGSKFTIASVDTGK